MRGLNAAYERWTESVPSPAPARSLVLTSARHGLESGVRKQFRGVLGLLAAICACLWAITIVNVSGLLAARLSERSREIGLRQALGATKSMVQLHGGLGRRRRGCPLVRPLTRSRMPIGSPPLCSPVESLESALRRRRQCLSQEQAPWRRRLPVARGGLWPAGPRAGRAGGGRGVPQAHAGFHHRPPPRDAAFPSRARPRALRRGPAQGGLSGMIAAGISSVRPRAISSWLGRGRRRPG